MNNRMIYFIMESLCLNAKKRILARIVRYVFSYHHHWQNEGMIIPFLLLVHQRNNFVVFCHFSLLIAYFYTRKVLRRDRTMYNYCTCRVVCYSVLLNRWFASGFFLNLIVVNLLIWSFNGFNVHVLSIPKYFIYPDILMWAILYKS